MKQIDKYRQEDPDSKPDHPEGESPAERVKWAIAVVEEESILIQELLADLRQSLTAVRLLENSPLRLSVLTLLSSAFPTSIH
jgi:hypothetical protein